MSNEAEKAREVIERRRSYFAFRDQRIPELHELAKPDPEYDDKGRIIPGRAGAFPGAKAREQADREWHDPSKNGAK